MATFRSWSNGSGRVGVGFEPMQIDNVGEEINDNNGEIGRLSDNNEEGGEGNWTVENTTIDLESYIQGYTGLARLMRLIFIAAHCPSLRVEALRLAIDYVMNTFNTGMYVQLHRSLKEVLSEGGTQNAPDLASTSFASPSAQGSSTGATGSPDKSLMMDQVWLEKRAHKAALKLEKLDTDLKNYKSNSIKESIRRGHDDLGDHYLDCGDLQNALKAYSRARDYCTSGRHVTNMCLNVIKVSIYLKNWSHVISYVNKAMATPDFAEGNKSADNQSIVTRLYCAWGLAELATHKYKQAARHFLQASLDHCDIPDMMSPQNVATYGGLCALATFDRSELHRLVITSSSFKLFLELDPQLREIIFSFYESKYGKCLNMLAEIKDNLLLDLYLSSHVSRLYSMIRNRGLVQYFSPYLSADLKLMASSFNTSVAALEEELMKLILEGQIQARIDSYNKVLYAQDIDQRSATFEKALEMGELFQRRARLLVLRSTLLNYNIHVKSQGRGVGGSAGQTVPSGSAAGQEAVPEMAQQN